MTAIKTDTVVQPDNLNLRAAIMQKTAEEIINLLTQTVGPVIKDQDRGCEPDSGTIDVLSVRMTDLERDLNDIRHLAVAILDYIGPE